MELYSNNKNIIRMELFGGKGKMSENKIVKTFDSKGILLIKNGLIVEAR